MSEGRVGGRLELSPAAPAAPCKDHEIHVLDAAASAAQGRLAAHTQGLGKSVLQLAPQQDRPVESLPHRPSLFLASA